MIYLETKIKGRKTGFHNAHHNSKQMSIVTMCPVQSACKIFSKI